MSSTLYRIGVLTRDVSLCVSSPGDGGRDAARERLRRLFPLPGVRGALLLGGFLRAPPSLLENRLEKFERGVVRPTRPRSNRSSLEEAAVRPDGRLHERSTHVSLETPRVILHVRRRAYGSSSALITSVGSRIPATTPIGFVFAWYSSSDAYPSAPYSSRCNSAMDLARHISSYDGDVDEDDHTRSLSRKNIFFTDARRYRSSNGSNRLNAPFRGVVPGTHARRRVERRRVAAFARVSHGETRPGALREPNTRARGETRPDRRDVRVEVVAVARRLNLAFGGERRGVLVGDRRRLETSGRGDTGEGDEIASGRGACASPRRRGRPAGGRRRRRWRWGRRGCLRTSRARSRRRRW